MGLENIDVVVSYNAWRGVSIKGVYDCFECLEKEDYENVEKGDVIWLDADPLNPNGKVYGLEKVIVSNVEDQGDHKRIYHSRGFTSSELKRAYRLTKPRKLSNLVKKHGEDITNFGSW